MSKKTSNDEFKKRLMESNKFYDSVFILKEEYQGLKHKILIEDEFGLCRILSSDLLYRNYKPRIESALDKTSYFINKANKIHNYIYDYSKSIYSTYKSKLIITCKEHGDFLQTPDNHWNGKGCPKCGNLNKSSFQKEFPTGWTLTNWKNKALISKKFDSFKVYIIKIFNENEVFYKIGRTFNTIDTRFTISNNLPYSFEIINIFEGTAEEVFKLENDLKRKNKDKKYIPNLKFDGMYECFNNIII
jgi:hypothetical protein